LKHGQSDNYELSSAADIPGERIGTCLLKPLLQAPWFYDSFTSESSESSVTEDSFSDLGGRSLLKLNNDAEDSSRVECSDGTSESSTYYLSKDKKVKTRNSRGEKRIKECMTEISPVTSLVVPDVQPDVYNIVPVKASTVGQSGCDVVTFSFPEFGHNSSRILTTELTGEQSVNSDTDSVLIPEKRGCSEKIPLASVMSNGSDSTDESVVPVSSLSAMSSVPLVRSQCKTTSDRTEVLSGTSDSKQKPLPIKVLKRRFKEARMMPNESLMEYAYRLQDYFREAYPASTYEWSVRLRETYIDTILEKHRKEVKEIEKKISPVRDCVKWTKFKAQMCVLSCKGY
jgi:hypothetical protein